MLIQALSRPRSVLLIILVTIPSLASYLYLYSSRPRQQAEGYKAPTTVLPSYISHASIPLCLPADYTGYEDGDEAAGEKDDGFTNGLHKAPHPTDHGKEDSISVDTITGMMQDHITALQSGFDPQADDDYLGLKIGKNWHLPSYNKELVGVYEKYLAHPSIPNPSWLPPLLSRLSLRPPIHPLPPMPKQILTTDKHKDIKELPWEFGHWKEVMPDWDVRYFDDDKLDDWVGKMFGGTRAEDIWRKLPRPVLKADIFRYMSLLIEGGIYTDSDTTPIVHADGWGYPHSNATPNLLTTLTDVLRHSNSPNQKVLKTKHLVNDGADLGPPSLIVSIESDAIRFGWYNWREVGLSRACQITQWTIMARPGHPIFLDAVGRSLERSEEIFKLEAEAKAKGQKFMPDSALDWTGPGVLYLLTRYGFKPRDLLFLEDPIRIGDVLILNAGSYSSVSPFNGEEQRKHAASWHGFFGRWRDDDPNIHEQERLKKLKEAEEERIKATEEERVTKENEAIKEAVLKEEKKEEAVQELLQGLDEVKEEGKLRAAEEVQNDETIIEKLSEISQMGED